MADSSSSDSSSTIVIKSKVIHLDKNDSDGKTYRRSKVRVPENSKELLAHLEIILTDARVWHAYQINHPNILKIYLRAPTDDDMYERYYAEAVKGKLRSYLINQSGRLRTQRADQPSETLVKFVRCMIDVLACINRWDQYHGDIRLNSFYYKIDMGKPEIRLGDFITDDFKTLEESQLDDWHKMGTLVLEIIDILQQHNMTTIIPMLEDLVNFFENLNNVADAEKAYMRAFFMNDEMKTKFMRVSLPFLIEKVGFNVKVNSIEVTLPWEFGKYDCLVTCVEIHNNQNYDRNNIYHFLRVLSATYEHFDLIYRQAFNMTQIGSLLPFTNSLSNFHEYMMIKYPKLVLQLRSIDLDL